MVLINFSKPKPQQLKDEAASDPILCELMNTIVTGWPESINQLPTDVRVYWSFRHELAIEANVVKSSKHAVNNPAIITSGSSRHCENTTIGMRLGVLA